LNSQSYEVRANKDHSESANVVVYEYEEIIEEIDAEMERLGWSVSDGIKYLSDRYSQKSRLYLSDEQLMEFWNYLSEQKSS
jgi:putative DNA primase/helicase